MEFSSEVEFLWVLRCKFNDFIAKLLKAFLVKNFSYCIFQENNNRKSMCADTEMKQIIILSEASYYRLALKIVFKGRSQFSF